MRKKYLNTIEDVEALRNTDTKIYKDTATGYYKFVNGVLCFFNTDSAYMFYNVTMDFNQVESKFYIEVEDEPSEDDIGKLGVFSNCYGFEGEVGVLERIVEGDHPYLSVSLYQYKYFRPLTPEEVEKYTGYKVVNNEMQASELANNKM